MAAPEGYTKLARIGYADKGTYAAGTTYVKGDMVYYNGSSYAALKDNLKGVTPTNGDNWKYTARGFAAEKLELVKAKDTSGVLGTAGAEVVSQALIDAIADKVMTKLLAKTNVVNNLLTTSAGYALDARQGKELKDITDALNSDFAALSIPISNEAYDIEPVPQNIAEGSEKDSFNWFHVPTSGRYLLVCNTKQYATSAADIRIYINDSTSHIKESSFGVLVAVIMFSANDVIKIKLKSTKGQYDVYSDSRYFFASLIKLK